MLVKLLVPFAVMFTLLGCSDTSKGLIDDITSIATSSLGEDTSAQDLKKKEVVINRVVDGDTVNVEMPDGTDESIRLLLIDTPESVHPDKPDQPYGEEASEFAKETLEEGQTVNLEIGDPERDKYDRLLGYIWINDDTNFNQLMIEKGFARVAYVYENKKYLNDFRKTAKQAEKKSENIWSIDGYVENEFKGYQ